MNYEGSVDVDNGSTTASQVQDNQVEEVQDENLETSQQERIEPKSEKTASPKGEQEEEQEKPVLTDKGTKLDPNPESAIHQQLANERRLRSDYEKVLTNPELLRKFAQEAGYSLTEAKEALKEEVFSAEKLQTNEDVAKALNEIKQEALSVKKENERLRSELEGITSSRRVEIVANNISSDIATVREEFPELNPKSAEYDPELEKEIGELYNELDFDPRTNAYKGNYSLAKLARKIMSAAGKARKKGSEQAQMDVKVKQTSKVVTSAKPVEDSGESSKDPATVIAQRIAKAFK